MYLLYVIKPIFEAATVDKVTEFNLSHNDAVLSVGLDELQELAYTIKQDGHINYFSLQTGAADVVPGKQLFSKVLSEQPLAKVIDVDNERKLIVDQQGNVQLISAQFQAIYQLDQREIVPNIQYPLGEDYLPVDEQAQALQHLAFAMNDELAVFVGFTQDGRLIKTSFIAEDDFNYDPAYEAIYQQIDTPYDQVDDVLVTPDLAMAFVRSADQVFVYDLTDEYDVELKATIIPQLAQSSAQPKHLTAMALLSGGSSVLLGDSRGMVSQWFEVSTDSGREFKQVRTFTASRYEAISQIITEQYRKSFYSVTATGQMGAFYTTSEAELWRGTLTDSLPTAMVIAPRADGLLLLNNNKVELYAVENEHPEVTWQALWQEVWYEGYPEPEYIWQSTSGSDDFEAKFSLVPISFGTVKAALYAMLFAVPIALTAAIYTAYFMTPALRKKVKPTIEIMEALPTVILGFLAGLWLAPIVENNLPAIALLLILLPLAVFLTAFGWHKLPKNIKDKLPESWAPILLIPVLILAAIIAFSLSPLMELYLFGGDVRQFITNDLGISFDQRNALVVGIAMGFAVIPTIFSMAEDAIFSVPKHLTSGSLALGATQWQTLVKVVLLTASPGIFSAIMMGLGRAVGETMIVLMATGNTPIVDWSIFQGMRTLAANIAVEMPESEVGSSHYRILFLAAFVLFVFTFIFNTLAEFVRQRLREKYSSL
ncbi:ABC transporter permease subunit [Thalassotalea insulae]|nr:ABC transporter permease subunit [Thalassotalea insulae]